MPLPQTLAVAVAVAALTVLLALPHAHADRDVPAGPTPSTELSPARVVEIVVDALRTNDQSTDDAGIATVWRFASPGNRASTGPLPRFSDMIKRGFPDMLAHESSRFDEIRIDADKALQAVWLRLPSGREVGYAFVLGRQSGGDHDGMWMTESVMPLGASERSGTRI